MDFALSEEQELLQETVRGFVENECPPGVVREVFDGENGAEPGLWKGLVEMGISGLLVPEAFGGAELELLDLALVSEELGRGAAPGPFLGHSLATLAVVLGGSTEQQQRWLPGLASGEVLGTVALAESLGDAEADPHDSWEPESWRTQAADGRVSGEKLWVPAAGPCDLLVVGVAGGRLALVEAGADGVACAPQRGVDRGRRVDRVTFEGARGELIEGDVARRVLDAGLVLLAADAFGAASRLVRVSAEYANSREQFGQPIGQFQALKHQLADMALEVEPTRGLWWYAAHAFAHLQDESQRAAALAKAHITDRAIEVARSAVEAHGGIGFTWESDVQMWFKRVLFDRHWLGTPEVHRERAARLGGW